MNAQKNSLIALGGLLRAGKDAIGDYLADEHDYRKLGMSDALNEALLALNPLIPCPRAYPRLLPRFKILVRLWNWANRNRPIYRRYQDFHEAVGYVEAKKIPEVRRLLQVLGTEVGREMIDQDVWVNTAERRIREFWDAGRNVVITAIRFPNELDMVRRLGGITVWVERPQEAREEGLGDSGVTTPGSTGEAVGEAHSAIRSHASENSVSAEQFDTVIKNDGTLEELYAKVEELLKDDCLLPGVDNLNTRYVQPEQLDIWPVYDR